MKRLTVLFDSHCGFCRRCAGWLARQEQAVSIELLPADAPLVRLRYPRLDVGARDELVVVSDEGGIYRGDRAFLMCLWALVDYREWSVRLARPPLRGLARRAFELLSSRRRDLSLLLDRSPARASGELRACDKHGDCGT